MTDIAIDIQGLSKRYRIGSAGKMHDTLGGALADMIARPVRSLRHLRKLSSFEEDGDQSDSIIWALKDVSFQVERGEAVGVIGQNGAGKSTLLKILSRITDPTEGRVVALGRMSSLLEVGTGFHPELTGRENVYLNGTILGMRRKEIESKFDAIVDFSGVEKFIDTPVKRYSSGMKVRLAFAVTAHLEPEILIVDEVLAVGDTAFQRKCMGKMGEVASEGRTVLLVSHNMAAINSLCDRAVLLERGSLVRHGPSGEVVNHYLRNVEEESGSDNSGPGVWTVRQTDGSHQAFVERIEMLDPATGAPKRHLTTGEAVAFRLHYRSSVDFREASIMFGVFTIEGTYLMRYNTEVDGVSSPIVKGASHIDCVFERFPLASGRYVLATTIGKKGIVPLYQNYNFGYLDVQPQFRDESVHAYDSRQCLIVADHIWQTNGKADAVASSSESHSR